MNNAILIIGDSGTGKSTAMRTLPPEQTFLINVVGKTLPFRGSNKNYTKLSPDGLTGNYYCTDNGPHIQRVIKMVNDKRPDIKYLVIDDLGYVCMNAFMKRALQKGYDRFSEIAYEFNQAIELVSNLRDDLWCFVTMHIETDKQGKTKPKTIGNMIDQYICIEGKFSYVFHTMVLEDQYKFLTRNDGIHMAKTGVDCFPQFIDNDMLAIVNTIKEFQGEDISQ